MKRTTKMRKRAAAARPRLKTRAKPRFAAAGSLTDEVLLPGEFRAFRAETRSSFELLSNKIVPVLATIQEGQADQKLQLAELAREVRQTLADHDRRLAALEARFT